MNFQIEVPYPNNYLFLPKEDMWKLADGLKEGTIFITKTGKDCGKYKKDGIYYSPLGNLRVVSVKEVTQENSVDKKSEIIELKKAW